MTSPSRVTRGRIADQPIADLFESIYETGKSGMARFRTALGTAQVWFHDGELIDAEMGRFTADAAILRLLKIRDGEFEIEPGPVDRQRSVKMATVQLLAHGRQRAARPGRAGASPGSGPSPAARMRPIVERRADSRPSSAAVQPRASSRPGSRAVRAARADDTNAHTAVLQHDPRTDPRRPPSREVPMDPRAEPAASPALPAEPRSRPVDSRVQPIEPRVQAIDPRSQPVPAPRAQHGSEEEPTVAIPSATIRRALDNKPPPTPIARPDAARPSPEPATPAPKRTTQFMFREPAAAPPPSAAAKPVASPPASQAPPPQARPASSAVPIATQRPPLGKPAASAPDDEAAATLVAGQVPKADVRPPKPRTPQPAAKAAAPKPKAASGWRFDLANDDDDDDPPTLDRTLMRPGPVPPPPTEGTARRPGGRTPPPARPAAAAGIPMPMGAPEVISEEYSHPISVPTDPSRFGPGGTMMLGVQGDDVAAAIAAAEAASEAAPEPMRPLPEDSTAHQTVVIRADDPRFQKGLAAAQAAASAPASGSAHVGRYEVLLRLARGGMGTVYLCRVTGEGGFRRLFALKVIREHLNSNRAYVEMLLEEARIASRLNHPNIVPILDIDIFSNQHYLVMDYVEGCTFSELLKLHPRSRPPDLVIPVILDALTGLHAAHTMIGDSGAIEPLVHCDFSPHNMLVGINGTCRIIDFGVARASHSLPLSGKPRYLSPEQVHGLPVDPRSDVFAAGVVLWNALTGETLFDGETAEQILHEVANAVIRKPSTVGLRPPACFDRICLKALERDPNRRYQTAEQMLVELRKVAIAEDLVAPSSTVGQWVMETFGGQIELRRQAAGLGSALGAERPSTALATLGPSGHSDDDLDASRTMMLRAPELSDAGGEQPGDDDEEGLQPRTKAVVFMAAFAFIAAGALTLWLAPHLLQGGFLDEYGEYVDLADGVPDEYLPDNPNVGLPPTKSPTTTAGKAGSTGDAAGSDGGTGGATDGDTDAEAETDTEGDSESESDGEPDDKKTKGKSGKGKTGKGKTGKGKSGKGKTGKGKADDGKTKDKTDGKPKGKPDDGKTDDGKPKGKTDGGDAPVDLDKLFRPPGG